MEGRWRSFSFFDFGRFGRDPVASGSVSRSLASGSVDPGSATASHLSVATVEESDDLPVPDINMLGRGMQRTGGGWRAGGLG